MRRLKILALTIAFLCGMVISANATVITYDNAADWEAAVEVFLTEDFSDSTLNAGISIVSGGGYSITAGVMHDVVGGTSNWETTISFTPSLLAWGGDFDFTPGGPGEGIDITMSLYSSGTEVGVATILNPAENPVGGEPFVGFFGFTSIAAFDEVIFSGAGQYAQAYPDAIETYELDNMRYAPVPEPSTMLLLGFGLIGLAGLGRKKFFRKGR